MSPILETRRLSRRFGGLLAVDDVSFGVAENELFGVVGPNGAGKSTLFNLLAGKVTPSTGEIIANGIRVERKRPHWRCRHGIARTFQLAQSFPNVTVGENVAMARAAASGVVGMLRGAAGGKGERQFRAELLERFALSGQAFRVANELTVFEQQRLALCLAVATGPSVLLLDEPSGGLIESEVRELQQIISGIRLSGTTVLIIDHKMSLIMSLCDRVLVMSSGRALALGTPAEVQANPEVRRSYLGELN